MTLCHDIHVHNDSAENFEHDFIWWVIVLQEYFWHEVLDLDSRKRDLHLFFFFKPFLPWRGLFGGNFSSQLPSPFKNNGPS